MVDNAMFYLIGTFYPLLTRATYPTLGFGQYAGEVGTSEADDAMKAKAAKDAEAALAEPLEGVRSFFLEGRDVRRRRPPLDRGHPGGRRRSSSCERSTTTSRPGPRSTWSALESTLGEAYSEPAQDVRDYIGYVRSQSG